MSWSRPKSPIYQIFGGKLAPYLNGPDKLSSGTTKRNKVDIPFIDLKTF